MAKLELEQQEELINSARKNVKYDTKEYTLELLHGKFNRYIDENNLTEIFIPFYQRNFVWDEKRQSKFIESLILGLPIPPMYFAEIENGFLEVIDGSQRIRTINAFLNNLLKLKGLEQLKQLNGLTFNEFSSSRKRKINNVSVRAVVVTDIEIGSMIIRHEIFERLNTGGVQLNENEIAKGAKEGDFIKSVYKDFAKDKILNELSGFTKNDTERGYKEEFIIKYLAFSESMTFKQSITDYLNNFIETKNEAFKEQSHANKYLTDFEIMLELVKGNQLADKIIKSKNKNGLLALYIGSNLALQQNSDLKNIDASWTDTFAEQFISNYQSSGFPTLKQNVQLVKDALLATAYE